MKIHARRLLAPSRIGCVLLGFAALLANCSDGAGLPEFPIYPPTEPFLEEQDQRKSRALAIAEFQRRERLKYGIKNQEENLAAWLPIYNRGENARQTKHLRDEARRQAFSRFQEQTTAAWLPIQQRIFVSRQSRPQREAIDQGQSRQFQELTTAQWLPHQMRVFEFRESRDQREFEAMIKRRQEIGFPSGTRLLKPDRTFESVP
jgi:hypothetical protein